MIKLSQPKPTRSLRKPLNLICILFLIVAGCAPSQVNNPPIERSCPPGKPETVEIKDTNPQIEWLHKAMLELLIEKVSRPNTTILLGPDVVLDFTGVNPNGDPILQFGPCVTLMSVSDFGIDETLPNASNSFASTQTPSSEPAAPQLIISSPSNFDNTVFGETPGPGRTPHSSGPLLIFGPHRENTQNQVFLSINCPADDPNNPDDWPSDNVRISGFRIHGPSFGSQEVNDIGIRVFRCLNIEISNMEIAGWGHAAISVKDDLGQGPGQEQQNNREGDRIGRPEQVRIFHNYIHHNQHPREGLLFDRSALGYGVVIGGGAWAQIYENVFDFNRHAIAATGESGGYEAFRNLVLKGGGYHYAGFHTHQFDIHGSGDNGFGGQAGVQFWYYENSFQYLAGPAIEIRGRPHLRIYIHDNIFAHEGLEDDWGDDAIHLDDRDDLDVIELGPNNVTDFDSYGQYRVCDFDGDGIDDLFLPTGKTWWFSGQGKYPWTYLSARTERLDQVRLGYFDDDLRCDVLAESGAEWVISSGGIGEWYSIGAFDAPLSEVFFGRFDPNYPDYRAGATKRTTHAFWRRQNGEWGEWYITPLSAPAWEYVGRSSFPMSRLRFGDFTGDGVTDVLAVQDGRWSISESGYGLWQRLNEYLADDVSSLYIADLNNNNIDDLIKLETDGDTFTWWVSDDGRSPWRQLKTYTFEGGSVQVFAFAGRFGAAPGGGVLLIDHDRIGHFFSEAEIATGVLPDWTSLFPY